MRIIAHLDMDAFFAAVEERDKPRLRGKPIVIGSDPEDGKGRGVVSTANYKAREYGIHSAMPITKAWRLAREKEKAGCAPAVFVATDFKRYNAASRNVFSYIKSRAKQVEQTSIDEAYIDLSFLETYERATEFASSMQEDINTREKLTCSIGIGPNKLIAKIASDIKKPKGLTVVREEDVEKFLAPLNIRKIPGVGPKTEQTLSNKKIKTIGELSKVGINELRDALGKCGEELYWKARGIYDGEVSDGGVAKSVGEQETFHNDTADPSYIAERLHALARGAWRRFLQEGFASWRRIVITVRFADFETKTKGHTLKTASSSENDFEFEAMRLFLPFLDARENKKRKLIRLVGVRLEKLS